MNGRRFLVILGGVLACGFFVWAVDWAGHRRALKTIRELSQDALCVVDLKEGSANAIASFTTSQTIKQFRVRACPERKHERLSLSFDGGSGFQYNGTISDAQEFGVGDMVPPGTYTVTLRQATGKHGGIVVILDKAAPVRGLTGWQIGSRAYLGLLFISGIWALANRKSSNRRRRASSALSFEYVSLGFFLAFFYLLCHEGGHALAEISFSRYDFSASDFWGIHGHPHSGGMDGPPLEIWQHNLITGGAVIAPTLVAWALFLFWRLWLSRRHNQIVRLYVSAGICNLILPHILLLGNLLGITNYGHEKAFIACMPGSEWLGITLSWCILLVSICIFWKTVPEPKQILQAQHIEYREL